MSMRPKLHRAARSRALLQMGLLGFIAALFVGASFVPGAPAMAIRVALVPATVAVLSLSLVRVFLKPHLRRFMLG